jgi:tetratricopeptide (TPR) repeat protein
MIARLVALLAVLVALPAGAAPIDDAKKAFAEGKAAFERGEYEKALSAYQRANMILPAPNLYYNIGATYERLGRYQEAALAFDKYFELAGTATSDEEKDFQEKLRARSEADRKRPNAPPVAAPQQPAQQPPVQQPPSYPQPYYAPAPYYAGAPLQQPREVRLREARSRRTRAIVLMAIGAPMSAAGIGVFSWALADLTLDTTSEAGWGFVGATLFVVGVTLWAPGAASFVKSSHDIKELSQDLAKPQPIPPGPRGF